MRDAQENQTTLGMIQGDMITRPAYFNSFLTGKHFIRPTLLLPILHANRYIVYLFVFPSCTVKHGSYSIHLRLVNCVTNRYNDRSLRPSDFVIWSLLTITNRVTDSLSWLPSPLKKLRSILAALLNVLSSNAAFGIDNLAM